MDWLSYTKHSLYHLGQLACRERWLLAQALLLLPTAKAALHLLGFQRVYTLLSWLAGTPRTPLTDAQAYDIKAFETEQIDVIPQKGPVLATTALGDVALREFVDLDLVVQPPDVPRAMEALVNLGYEPASGNPPDFALPPAKSQFGLRHRQHGVAVELHWKLLEDRLAYHLDMDAMWARPGEARIHGRVVPSLGDEDLVLVLCTHGIKHYWMRLHWLCCVAELLRVRSDLDWNVLFERTTRAGALRTFSLVLFLAHTLLDVPLPAEMQNRITSDPALHPPRFADYGVNLLPAR